MKASNVYGSKVGSLVGNEPPGTPKKEETINLSSFSKGELGGTDINSRIQTTIALNRQERERAAGTPRGSANLSKLAVAIDLTASSKAAEANADLNGTIQGAIALNKPKNAPAGSPRGSASTSTLMGLDFPNSPRSRNVPSSNLGVDEHNWLNKVQNAIQTGDESGFSTLMGVGYPLSLKTRSQFIVENTSGRKGGEISIVSRILKLGPMLIEHWTAAVCNAIKHNNRVMLVLLLEQEPQGEAGWHDAVLTEQILKGRGKALLSAAGNGCIELVGLMLELYQITTKDLGIAVEKAASEGHLAVVKRIMQKNQITREDCAKAIVAAENKQHPEIAQFLKGCLNASCCTIL